MKSNSYKIPIRKVLIPSFFLIFFMSLLPRTIMANQVTIKVPVATIRQGPSHDFPGIGVAYQGESLESIDEEENWFKVRMPNHSEGWIWGKLVKAPDKKTQKGAFTEDAGNIENDPHETKPLTLSLKVIRSAVNMRQGPGVSHAWIETARANDLLIAFEEKDGWYRCKTPSGKEGWIIGSSVSMVPIHSESAKSEIRRVIINNEEMSVRAGPADAYPSLGKLLIDEEVGVYLEEAQWLYIKSSDQKIEGWITEDGIYDPEKQKDFDTLREEALNISEKLIIYYDQKKKEAIAYQDAGWYPSYSLFLKEKDILIDPLPDGLRIDLTLSLRKISIETLFPLPVETIPISLTRSDQIFFMTLFQALMENHSYKEIVFHLNGLKEERGSLKWIDAGNISLKRSKLEGIDLDKTDVNAFWELLKHDKIRYSSFNDT